MREYNTSTIVQRFIGPVSPVGETHEDDRRYDNLKELCELTDNLIQSINYITSYSDDYRYSMSRAGKHAKNYLKSLRDYTED